MRSFVFNDITIAVAFKATCSRRAQLWNRQASIIMDLTPLALRRGWHRLPRVMTTEEILKALGRYAKESCESDRQTATTLGVKRMTLTAWLGGRDRPQRCM